MSYNWYYYECKYRPARLTRLLFFHQNDVDTSHRVIVSQCTVKHHTDIINFACMMWNFVRISASLSALCTNINQICHWHCISCKILPHFDVRPISVAKKLQKLQIFFCMKKYFYHYDWLIVHYNQDPELDCPAAVSWRRVAGGGQPEAGGAGGRGGGAGEAHLPLQQGQPRARQRLHQEPGGHADKVSWAQIVMHSK